MVAYVVSVSEEHGAPVPLYLFLAIIQTYK